MFVLLRHPHDEDPETTYSLDPHITSKGIKSIRNMIKELVSEYGVPKYIYCSPLTRCRESAYIIAKYLAKKYDKNIRVIIDPRISRYFSSNVLYYPFQVLFLFAPHMVSF